MKYNTLLDVIIALLDFNKNNQDYFTFIARNVHSGYNKIHWQKTIASTMPIFMKGQPIYTAPVNRKKMVNFDEELLIIFFSILNYISEEHGFTFYANLNYQLISPDKIKRSYIDKNQGCRRLKQIKYKYFSDKALRIWDLCYAFFDREYKIAINRQAEDFLLAKNFNIIFEAMIDELISGEDKDSLPKELKDQKDGKLVDHMFIGQGLIEQSDLQSELTYYIGDSKYYKRSKGDTTTLGDKSIYKQYTYAKNVIQWNMSLFLDGDDKGEQPQLRDSLTEGYNPIPNFFISARIPNRKDGRKFLSFDDEELEAQANGVQFNRQFENRLFDRDTLLLCHYDVNFLYIVSLYGRANKSKQATWREKVRKEFREKIQDTFNRLYTFYIIQPRAGMDCYRFLKENFSQLNGKLYRARSNKNYLILALMKDDEESKRQWEALRVKPSVIEKEMGNNEVVLKNVETHFHKSKLPALGSELQIEPLPDVGTLEPLPYTAEDLVLLITKEGVNYDYAIQLLEETGKVGIALKMDGATLQLVEGFTKARFLIIHNKHKYEVFCFDGKGPKLIPGNAAEPMVVTKKDEDLYLVYQVNTHVRFHLGELDLSEVIKGGEGYNPQLLPLSKLQKGASKN